MMINGTRDFVGYGQHLPDPKWPKGARLAVNFVMNYEEGSEPSIMDGDGRTQLPSDPGPSPAFGSSRNLAAESMFEYGSRIGFWRLYRLFRERNLPLTVNGCAVALERHPEAASAIAEAGYDICCHGYRWIEHWLLDEAKEREQIQKAVESLKATVGQRPLGWYCRYGASVNTRQLVVDEGGFLYDSDYYGDELPFWTKVGEKTHLVIPYNLITNDTQIIYGSISTASEFFEILRDSFDVLREEGAEQPRMMSVGLHLRTAGHPARAKGLAQFLDYVQSHDDVWICGRDEIAKHWHTHHKPVAI